ncbi:MAG TPA: ATP-grasp domain-containing protein [Vicinamibacterales bacterium]|nr:ATP-grasp domain-containing protein [Vicinamibacterales bacterium]
MNLLLTCGGARSYLLQILRAAVGAGGRVLTCDSAPDAPALQHADKGLLVPDIADPGHLGALLELCRKERIDLLIPSMEHELPLLAAHRADFAAVGTTILVSTPGVVETCGDKLEAAAFLTASGVAVPRTWLSVEDARDALSRGDLTFPVVVKPRWGVSSIGLSFPEDEDELRLAWAVTRRIVARSSLAALSAADAERSVLIQERVAGDEYGFDVVNDLRGRHVTTLVRRKLRMRAGQTDRAEAVRHQTIEAIGERIGRRLGHVGVLDCDAIATASSCCVLDINPRIGGGYPFSHLAGADIPAALVAWMQGDEPDPAWLQTIAGIKGARYDGFLLLNGADSAAAAKSVGSVGSGFPDHEMRLT